MKERNKNSMTDMKEILRLLKAAKESELEVIKQLIEREESEYDNSKDEKSKHVTKDSDSDNAAEKSYDDMTVAELYKLCCQRGLSGKCKSRKRDDLIAILNGDTADDKKTKRTSKKGGAKKDKKEPENAQESEYEDWGEDENETMDYDSMTAKQLYEECVKRGIEAEKRKKPADYIKLLKVDDDHSGESDSDGDDDEDWEFD